MTRKEIIDHIRESRSFLCVGLDTDLKKIPEHLLSEEDPMFAFNKAIVDATAPYCVAYKPNIAFYESLGVDGWLALQKTVDYIRQNHPRHFIIADAKRGDIGNTSKMYATTFFEKMDFDSVTVAPYMGSDSMKPFLDHSGRWVILLALTSNPGSHDFQFMEDADGTPLWRRVIETSQHWADEEQLMYVVGATQGRMFEQIRRAAPRSFLLVPGVGAQGGSLEEVCRYGFNDDCGLLVNSSRGIIYASNGSDFAEAAAAAAKELAGKMADILDEHNF